VSPYIILDTGPLVAALDRRDRFHFWASKQLLAPSAAFLTSEAVLTEAIFLLMRASLDIQPLLEFAEEAPLLFPFSYSQNRSSIHRLLLGYNDVPMSFADACLVQLSELYPDAPILTLDSDFLFYRRNRNERLPLLIPPELQ
jgi:uncharacterized protein